MSDYKYGICDVCEDEEAVGVAAAPGIPISLAYGAKCLEAGLHYPLWLLIGNTATIDGYEFAADWWKEQVDRHLEYFKVSRAEFDEKVEDMMEEIAAQAAEADAEYKRTEEGQETCTFIQLTVEDNGNGE